MSQEFRVGDFLIFQIESGFGLLQVLDVDTDKPEPVWHLKTYRDLYPDVEFADHAVTEPANLTPEIEHIALTDRAFKSTQVSKLTNHPLKPDDLTAYENWKNDPNREISDRSIRLTLGLR